LKTYSVWYFSSLSRAKRLTTVTGRLVMMASLIILNQLCSWLLLNTYINNKNRESKQLNSHIFPTYKRHFENAELRHLNSKPP